MQLTKTTTRAFAASLALVAAGGTMAGAAVFHLPILGINGASASSNIAPPPAKPAVPVARKKAHKKVVVKTRYADVIVHVPAPSGRTVAAATRVTASPTPAPNMEPTSSSSEPDDSEPEISEPESTTTSISTPTTIAEHDDEGEHDDGHESDDDEHEHVGETTSTTVAQP